MLAPQRTLRPPDAPAHKPAIWCPVPLAALLACAMHGASAQTPANAVAAPAIAAPALDLELSTRLLEQLPKDTLEQAPSFVFGERMTGQVDAHIVVEGQAELRRHDLILRADRLEHQAEQNKIKATGQVRINLEGNRFDGTALELQLDTRVGHFDQTAFSFLRAGGHGEASRLDFEGRDQMVAHDVRYTTCPRSNADAWQPDWYFSARRIVFDQQEDTGTASQAVLHFQGVPLLAAPWISFPLSDRRKSGALPPSFNLDNRSGLEVTAPYYLNLAPNRDATLYPTVMSRRGIDLAGEYRYLQRDHAGTLRAAYMPNDRLRNEDRWAASFQHQQVWPGLMGSAPVNLRMNLNRVSDDNYWRDFPRTSTTLTERLLPSDVVLSTAAGAWSFSAGSYRWQTLQDAAAPIVAPYDRLPSLSARFQPEQLPWRGSENFDFSFLTDITSFRTDRRPVVGALNQTTDVNATRWLGVANLSRTWQIPGAYLRPALRLHARHYQFEQPVGPQGARSRQESLLIPTASVDGGLFFDRSTAFLGREVLQTLEPRVFYTVTPFREQGYLPVYDSSAFDFNLATIFTPNVYGGNDRIADLHTVTLGLTSRMLSPDTGTEWLHVGVAQRLRLEDQNVVLPGQSPIRETLSDVLFGGAVNWHPQWSFRGTVQYNPETGDSIRTTLGGRYQPGDYRVLSAAYRLQRGRSEQIDLGWQWPLRDLLGGPRVPAIGPGRGLGPGHWYSVGRLNYSLPERRIVDLIAGFEYDAGCWISRIVLERLQHSPANATQRILFQLEFSGFSRLGMNPLQALRHHIPRYQLLREQIHPPSRFERYD